VFLFYTCMRFLNVCRRLSTFLAIGVTRGPDTCRLIGWHSTAQEAPYIQIVLDKKNPLTVIIGQNTHPAVVRQRYQNLRVNPMGKIVIILRDTFKNSMHGLNKNTPIHTKLLMLRSCSTIQVIHVPICLTYVGTLKN